MGSKWRNESWGSRKFIFIQSTDESTQCSMAPGSSFAPLPSSVFSTLEKNQEKKWNRKWKFLRLYRRRLMETEKRRAAMVMATATAVVKSYGMRRVSISGRAMELLASTWAVHYFAQREGTLPRTLQLLLALFHFLHLHASLRFTSLHFALPPTSFTTHSVSQHHSTCQTKTFREWPMWINITGTPTRPLKITTCMNFYFILLQRQSVLLSGLSERIERIFSRYWLPVPNWDYGSALRTPAFRATTLAPVFDQVSKWSMSFSNWWTLKEVNRIFSDPLLCRSEFISAVKRHPLKISLQKDWNWIQLPSRTDEDKIKL